MAGTCLPRFIMTDSSTTFEKLKRQVSEFRDARDWLKYDNPRSLAISISIEAAELLEHFQWKSDEQMRSVIKEKGTMEEVSDELADVVIYCLGFSDVVGIDLSTAVERKLRKNAEKYPIEKPRISA